MDRILDGNAIVRFGCQLEREYDCERIIQARAGWTPSQGNSARAQHFPNEFEYPAAPPP